jgi:hypothetical protein
MDSLKSAKIYIRVYMEFSLYNFEFLSSPAAFVKFHQCGKGLSSMQSFIEDKNIIFSPMRAGGKIGKKVSPGETFHVYDSKRTTRCLAYSLYTSSTNSTVKIDVVQ